MNMLVAQLCLILCTSMNCSLPASSVRGILQSRVLEWKKKKEYWSGLPFSSLEHLPDPGIKPGSPALQADSLVLSHLGNPKTELCKDR